MAEKEGSVFVLDCLQRIEGEMREGDHLFRIAGDKFVLLASSEAYETVLDQAERVFRRNGEKVHYQGNAVELAMFGGLIRLDQGMPGLSGFLRNWMVSLEGAGN